MNKLWLLRVSLLGLLFFGMTYWSFVVRVQPDDVAKSFFVKHPIADYVNSLPKNDPETCAKRIMAEVPPNQHL